VRVAGRGIDHMLDRHRPGVPRQREFVSDCLE